MASEMSGSSRAMRRGALLDHRDLGSEAAEHLGEFQPDIAAADDDQMLGQEVELHHRASW